MRHEDLVSISLLSRPEGPTCFQGILTGFGGRSKIINGEYTCGRLKEKISIMRNSFSSAPKVAICFIIFNV